MTRARPSLAELPVGASGHPDSPEALSDGGRVARASFRDPAGCLLDVDGRLLRLVHPGAVADLQRFLGSRAAGRLVEQRQLVSTRALAGADAARVPLPDDWPVPGLVVEHGRVAFPSFPYEWPPEMLQEAGRLTLALAEGLLAEGMGLKDATPYNVLFEGPRAVFVDVLSAESREPRDPTWLPHAQFTGAFLLPLLAARSFGVALQQSLPGRRDGLQPEALYRLCSPARRLLPPFLGLAALPTWLAARADRSGETLYERRLLGDPEQARFVLGATLKQLRRALARAGAGGRAASAWSSYPKSHSYAAAALAAKRAFCETAVDEFTPRWTLDVGCNTGTFSQLAARGGSRVVAIDSDPVVIGQLWQAAAAEALDIQPLVVDLARPTPALGWRNRECPAFLERARGRFELVLMLAVVHHLLVTERIPLPEVFDLAAELTTDLLLVEFVPPSDPMFRRLCRGREALHADLTAASFEAALARQFTLLRQQELPGSGRRLYLARKRARA